MDSKMSRSLATMKDLKSQPDSKYILVIDNGATENSISVDGFRVADGIVEFYRGDPAKSHLTGAPTVIYACRIDARWSLLHRSLVDLVTVEDYIRHTAEDMAKVQSMHKELHIEDDKDKPAPGQYV